MASLPGGPPIFPQSSCKGGLEGSGWRRAKVGRMRQGRKDWIKEGKGGEIGDDKGQWLQGGLCNYYSDNYC